MDAKTYLTKESFCVLPWTGVYIQPNGEVRNCAITKDTLGNINDTDLESILRGELNQTIKQDMLNDIKHPRCGQCHRLEQNQKKSFDQVSNRVWYIKKLKNSDFNLYDSPDNFNLKILDLRWKNTCNFACVYCDSDLSSRWAKELGQPQKIESDALAKSLNFVYENLQQVEHIYLAGGEPLLMRENQILLEKLLIINPNVEIRINTNLSTLNNDIYRLLKKFKNVHWTVSIDNLKEEFEYVRYGGEWNVFLDNLKILTADFNIINFNLVWCVLNGQSILDCIDFLVNELGFHENAIIVNPLESPLWLNVNNLPDYKLDEIANKINTKIKQTNSTFCLNNSLVLMLNFIDKNFKKDLNLTFSELQKIDQRRGLDSKKILPGLYDI